MRVKDQENTGSMPPETLSANSEIVPVGAIEVRRALRIPCVAMESRIDCGSARHSFDSASSGPASLRIFCRYAANASTWFVLAATFAVGALVPLLPFLFASRTPAVVAAIAASGVALFAVGAAMSVLTGRNPVVSGARMLLVGGVAASITFGVGRLFHVAA